MDPPAGPNGPLQRQDASDDGELPLSDDIYRSYTDLKAFPEETVYNGTSHDLIIPINFKPEPQGEEDHRSRARPVPVRPPPPPPTRGACLLARAGSLPPPVPPRTQAPLKKQLSSDPANLSRRLNRSTTQVETYVSNPSRFLFFSCLAKNTPFHYDPYPSRLFTSGPIYHQTDRHSTRQHQESGCFL